MNQDLTKAYMNHIKASVVDSFSDFISIANKDREIIYFNAAAYRMMGYDPNDHPEITSTAQLHAEGFEEFAATVIQPSVFKNGSWTGISAIRDKDGATLMVEMTVFPIYGEDGEEYGTVAMMRDVNELAKMNERLQKSSELFQKILDSAKIGIVLINMETHTITMANRFTEELLQMSREEIVGHTCYDVLCHSDPSLCPHVLERDKPVLLAERYLRRRDGTSVPIIKTGTWITLDDKDFLVDTFVDISIQKDLENSLSEAKLVAEAASRAKSEFLSRMSHEMRTPLNAVIGMTQIAQKTNDATKLLECIQTIQLSSTHLLNLINDILDLSKIEEGKLELNLDDFSLTAMMNKITVLVQPKVEEKRIRFTLDMDKDIPPFVTGDALRLSQILLNFLSNAIKFTPEEKQISLSLRVMKQEGNTVSLHFTVSDQGIGITREQLSRLFSPFVQADGSITRKYGGTGLGLVISKRLLNLMGTDIEVQSEEGQGSTFAFTLTLPIATGAKAPEAEPLPDIQHIFAGKRALIADDVELNRVIAMELLKETGLAFDEACDGREALEKAARTPYDVILMDIQMPVMDGYEATHQIRALPPPFSQTPIVAMSANVFKEDMERSLREGMDGHVGKPIDLQQLVRLIHHLFHPKAAKKAAAAIPAFKPNPQQAPWEKRYFDYEAALALHHGDLAALAAHCWAFVTDSTMSTLRQAMADKAYGKAQEALVLLRETARRLALGSLSSYAGNVAENLAAQNHSHASMYFADLEKSDAATRDIIGQLMEGGPKG